MSPELDYIEKLPEDRKTLLKEIIRLKEELGVTILAHNYQREEVQLIADYLGDSLGLARKASNEVNSKYILFAGVRFMAETAAILNPDKTVLFPESSSKCSMAMYANADILREYKEKNPQIPIVLYINSTAETKTQADIICTSSNAIKIVKKITEEFGASKFAFSPDRNLGSYVSKKLNMPVDILPPDGNCYVHHQYTTEMVKKVRSQYPDAKLLTHPEAPFEVLELSDFIGSTSQIINYAEQNKEQYKTLIIGTENGVVDLLRRRLPNKTIVPLDENAICEGMKKITPEKILTTLKNIEDQKYHVKVKKEIAEKCIDAIEKMMKYS
ncbi:MAG: quinolinate synthase NadA [Promethearchaeota archaeon]